jgi:uncharacterized repeat protein (TIGR03803 family)
MSGIFVSLWQSGERSSRRRHARRTKRQTPHRLMLEPLEDRLAPASLVPLASFFDANNGSGPNGVLIGDGSGNLFGTTNAGGALGRGTVFEVAPNGSISDLVYFNGADGAYPNGGLVRDSSNGNLFGTTNGSSTPGLGTVFEVVKSNGTWTITTLAVFQGGSEGSYPNGGLVLDGGYLYGSTPDGGAYGQGSVFKLKADGSGPPITVASFPGGNGSMNPQGGLVEDSNGNLFGTTLNGGSLTAISTVFEVKPDGTITTLASFSIDISVNPGLVLYGGNLFGTTPNGGAYENLEIGVDGGTVFELKQDSSSSTGFTLVTLASFDGYNGRGYNASLVADGSGNLFGTTDNPFSGRSVFELPTDSSTMTGYADTISIYASNGVTYGGLFNAGLFEDNSGNFFGTTNGGPAGIGTVFEVPSGGGTISTFASFSYSSGNTGAAPFAGLVEDSSGNLFGTTSGGGAFQDGTVFEVAQGSSAITTLASFNGADGADPNTGLVVDSNGNLFGTTFGGSPNVASTVFEVVHGSGAITDLAFFNEDSPSGLVEFGGNFFGTTSYGGANGQGSVFEVKQDSTSSTGYTVVTLVSFNGANGKYPFDDVLAVDSSGNVFGTTGYGGAFGRGTVFELKPDSSSSTGFTLVTLASFNNDSPTFAGLVVDASDNLFGVTQTGGTLDMGTVFEVVQGSGAITTLASFNGSNGSYPFSALTEDNNGNLFGTEDNGGTFGFGSVFEVVQGSGAITTLVSFAGGNGSYPNGSLVLDSNGYLFGTTNAGGTLDNGTVFEVIRDVLSHNELQAALNGQPSVDPVTGNPTLAYQTSQQTQANEFFALFQNPSTPGFTPLTVPAGATTPIDIVVTLGAGISVNEANLFIPAGIRVQINGGTWYGGSPALTLSSGYLTVTGAKFINATGAPTIRVTGGNLTLRNDTVQETSTGNQAAIAISGSSSVDLGTSTQPGHNTFNINSTDSFIANTGSNPVSALGDTFALNGTAFNLTNLNSDFAVSDLILDALDAGGGGLVTYVANNVYVTPTSGSIQRGVDAVTKNFASGAGTVNVEAGNYQSYTVGSHLLTVSFQNGPSLAQLADALMPGLTALTVNGTAGNDTILFNPGSATGSIVATINNLPAGTFAPTGRLIASGGAGNDVITVSNAITLPAWVFGGDGNDVVKAGNSNNTVTLGNGTDTAQLGNGNNTVTLGHGSDTVQLGNGNNVVVTGNGTDTIQAGNGDNLIAAGLGQHTVQVGNGSNILIDGTVTLTQSGDSLRQVLTDWISYGATTADVASIRKRLQVTYNTTYANRLMAGSGLDWFWETYAKDTTNRKASDLLN